VLARAGLAGAPADAAEEVRAASHWVSALGGGRGAVREFIELVLRAQERWDGIVRDFSA
jgi:3-deoxy-D-manno-octulosonate 8-phosphate phosphatase (KDO 8-P phosphatase)